MSVTDFEKRKENWIWGEENGIPFPLRVKYADDVVARLRRVEFLVRLGVFLRLSAGCIYDYKNEQP